MVGQDDRHRQAEHGGSGSVTLAARVLAAMGIELAAVRAAVDLTVGRGEQPVTGEAELTPRAKRD